MKMQRRKRAPRADRFQLFERAVGARGRRVRWYLAGSVYFVDFSRS